MIHEKPLDGIIGDFCRRVMPDFKEIRLNLEELHPEWSKRDFAANLMEFGRGQISKIDEQKQDDLDFIVKYVDSLKFDNLESALFSAYAGGCIMGLVQTDQLSSSDFVAALQFSAKFGRDIE